MIFEYIISFLIGIGVYLFLPRRFGIWKRIALGLSIFILLAIFWTILVIMAAMAPLGGKQLTPKEWETWKEQSRMAISNSGVINIQQNNE